MGEALGLAVVVVAAAVVATVVYRLAVRRGTGAEWSGSGWSGGATSSGGWTTGGAATPGPAGSETPGAGPLLPVPKEQASPRDRLTGIVGLLVMVSLGAILLALGLYAGGSMLAHLLSKAAHSGG